MAAVFSSKSVRHAHSAKPSLLRPLWWTIGIQAALGGVLVMIHDQVFPEGTETGAVVMSFTDAGAEASDAGISAEHQIKVLPPVTVPAGMDGKENDREARREMPLLAVNEVLLPSDLPSTEKSSELFLVNEDFGSLLRSVENLAKSSKSSKSRGTKRGASASASSLAAASPAKGKRIATSARYKSAPLPPYPRAARSEGREGVVMLKLLIDEEGNPVDVCLAKSSGSSLLDDTALAWVKNNWLFYPATDETGPVESAMIAPLRFKLNS